MQDAYELWEQYEVMKEKAICKLPVCYECGEHIQDETCYEINGELICEECLKDNHRKWTDDYV